MPSRRLATPEHPPKIRLKISRILADEIDEHNRKAVRSHQRGWAHSLVIEKSAAVSSRVEVLLEKAFLASVTKGRRALRLVGAR
jgi:hypothetical protein